MATVLLVDQDPSVRGVLTKALARFGHDALTASNAAEALQALSANHIDLVICDWNMSAASAGQLDGLELLRALREEDRDVPVIMLTEFGTIEHAVSAMRAGATHYLAKPFQNEQLQLTVEQALAVARLRDENRALLRELQGRRSEHEIIGEGRAIRQLLDSVASAASSRATVLLQGEPGTGKELLARAIHAQSDRREGPFIRMNCAALPEGQIESALFGHEKGALMGSPKRSLGALERANGGTLLLDEIAELPADLQPKLLRVLQEREFERIGGSGAVKADIRIVATTTRDLEAEVSAGRFRQDLYYRLNVFPISIQPLRDRREDIPVLAHRFAARAAAEAGKELQGFEPEALELLCGHAWPGNVRQLQNAVERAVILSTDPTLRVHLFASLQATVQEEEPAAGSSIPGEGATTAAPSNGAHVLALPSLDLMEVERRVIEQALALTKGNRTRAAQMLGINVRTLRRKLNGGGDDAGDPEVRGRVA
ncbi:MAG TPA: sigma-54 dependent transcriptional regulator [Gemmatimonadaceae bacterium]|jgi:DNA-binding NtrC family response regulator|nr:sigma-54 dependent transcriptional regulator [Gemmatimonadaceae bacterium]